LTAFSKDIGDVQFEGEEESNKMANKILYMILPHLWDRIKEMQEEKKLRLNEESSNLKDNDIESLLNQSLF
jgi:hypothetical protein